MNRALIGPAASGLSQLLNRDRNHVHHDVFGQRTSIVCAYTPLVGRACSRAPYDRLYGLHSVARFPGQYLHK
jgi:hypothetical protein